MAVVVGVSYLNPDETTVHYITGILRVHNIHLRSLQLESVSFTPVYKMQSCCRLV